MQFVDKMEATMNVVKDDDKEKDKKNGSWLLMKCSSHTSIEEGIPDDVVSEVLTRIPIKNVFQCKSVSKSWHSIIRDSSFLRAYNARNPCPGGLLVYKYRRADDGDRVWFHYASLQCLDGERKALVEKFVKLLDMPMKHYDAFTQVVNGLTCFYSCNRVSLCNLATREIIRLPNPPWVEEKGYTISASICYLGFDPINQVYKVLRISQVSRLGVFTVKLDGVNNCYSRIVCHILTLTKSNGGCYFWRKLSDVEPFQFQTKSWLVNEVTVYWIKPNPVRANFAREITCFDFSEEKFLFLEFPESARQHFQPHVLVQYALMPYKGRPSLLFFVGCWLILYTLEDHKGHA